MSRTSFNSSALWAALLVAALTLSSCVRAARDERAGSNLVTPTPVAVTSAGATPTPSPTPTPLPPPEFDAAEWYAAQDDDPATHAVLAETLEPGRVFAALNVDEPFNPASLVKLATTLAALKRLGPDYRFEITVYADGALDKDGKLLGDLYVAGSSPTFGDVGANLFANELKRLGVKRMAGRLKVSPDFCFNLSDSAETSAKRLAKALRLDETPEIEIAERPAGTPLLVFRSHPLRQVLLYMNAHSDNFVAHRVGALAGGPEGVRRVLVEDVGIPPEEVTLSTTSGLEHNALTGRGLIKLLRALDAEAARHGMKPADLMPVASEDTGTLRRRLRATSLEGALVGKTGTLTDTDGGMASLAGYIHTEESGRLAFVILDKGRRVWKSRKQAEKLLEEMLADRVSPQEVAVSTPRDLLPETSMNIERKGAPPRAPWHSSRAAATHAE